MAEQAQFNVPDSSDNSSLRVTGIPQLQAPEADSNYLKWSFVVKVHLNSISLGYLLKEVKPEDRNAKWAKDNADVCSFIVRTIHQDNLRLIQAYPDDAKGMWDALHEAHLDSTAGGRIYWLRKLVLLRLTEDDIDSHIKEMAVCAERLNSLVTAEKPLTVDDIHAAALLGSLPVDWLHCVSAMMNEENVTSARIVAALKAESLRRKARVEGAVSVSAAQSRTSSNTRTRPPFNESLFCSFCRIKGHELSACK
ncbi:hypothetical protein PTTG_30826, partial [Puccinia triticina 1-1 BBBD Race 1]